MMNNTTEPVWDKENYTNEIHSALKYLMTNQVRQATGIQGLCDAVARGFRWLKLEDDRQKALLRKIVSTGLRKWVQQGLVVEVKSNVSVEKQFLSRKWLPESGYISITSEDHVAKTQKARKKSSNRALNAMDLFRLNRESVPATGSALMGA